MIYAKMIGGLGNQMFQYAMGRALAEKRQTELALDISGYQIRTEGETPRAFELDCFQHAGRPMNETELALLDKALNSGRLSRILTRHKSKLTVVREDGFPFQASALDAPDGSYLSGYWQCERYFSDIRDTLLQEFRPRTELDAANKAILNKIKASDAISLHVRRGDYVTNPNAANHHGTKETEYYDRAVAMMAEGVTKPHIFVFSDDIAWCQANFDFDHPTTYVDTNHGSDGYRDIVLMSQCKHHIIANSSFSWWGAWLNPSETKRVIAPKEWFNNPDIDTRDIYAAGWEKL